MFAGQTEQQPGPWLATCAALVRAMRAVGHGRDLRAPPLQLTNHTLIDRLDPLARDEAAIDDRLVRDDEDLNAGSGEPGDRLRYIGEEAKLAPTLDVIHSVLVDHAVSIEEHS